MSENKNSKKSFYKRWWFWAIIVVLVIAIFGNSSSKDAKKTGSVDSSNTQLSKSDNTTSSNTSKNSSEESQKEEKKTEFKVGDIISFDNKEVVVTNVVRDYNTGNEFSVPKSGKEFVKITVKIENKSKNEVSYGPYNFKIKDSNGTITDHSIVTYSLEDNFQYGELAENGKVTSSLVFEVPKSDSNLSLIYESSFWSSKKIEIKL